MSLGEWNGFRLRLAQAACLKNNWSHLVFVCFFFFLPQSHHLLLPTGCVTLAVFLSSNLIFSNYLSFRLNDE